MDRTLVIILSVVFGVVMLGTGIGIGVAIGKNSVDTPTNPETRQADKTISDQIMNAIQAKNIRENLKILTAKPHVAGTEADLSGAQYIEKTWLEQGMDTVKLVPYKVLLQYPPDPASADRNKVEIHNPDDPSNPVFITAAQEDPFGEKELLQDNLLPPYNAYSGTGDVQGELVYVNYAELDDLDFVNASFGISLEGKILIAKYGNIGRGTKAMNAERYGAIGLILYSDPADYSSSVGEAYPDGPFLPSTAAQRGSIFIDSGDPLTPGYPSTEYFYRVNANETALPTIPVHPIGYSDAQELLSKMDGEEVLDWTGGLNITYRVGPGYANPYNNMTTRMVVNSKSEQRWAYNVIGYIRGELEPDRYVMIGNHRDSWVLGSVDPTSGTACLLEITRVFGKLKKEGWRPRRTLMFGSWGAEEFGLIGSVEYTEEFYRNLVERMVTYLNLDIAVTGDYVLSASASPHLRNVILEASKKVAEPNPEGDRKTVYDAMKIRRSTNSTDPNSIPYVHNIGAGSDYYGFMYGVGVSCISAYYLYDYDTYTVKFYSLYHTSYETFRLMDEIIDPGFKTHNAVSKLFAEMLRHLSEELILPMQVTAYAESIEDKFENLLSSPLREELNEQGLSLEFLQDAIVNFTSAARMFDDNLVNTDKERALGIRRVNDQMMLLDRVFMDREGLPRLDHLDPFQRHVIFAPTNNQGTRYATFPGLEDAMYNIDLAIDPEQRWKSVEKHISVLTFTIQSAASTLMDVTSW